MTAFELLAVLGLMIDCGGAILLVGNEWRWTVDFAKRVDSRFENLDAGLNITCNEYDELEEGDDGFDELFDLVQSQPSSLSVPLAAVRPVRIEPPDTPRGKLSFVFESQRPESFPNLDETHRWDVSVIEERANQKLQT